MADDWILKKISEEMTPRRAIDNFIAFGTPVDSPDPEELAQLQDVSYSTAFNLKNL